MPRTIGTAAQKVDAIRLTTALATTAGQAIACRKLSILALIVPVLIAGLEHSIYLHSREDQSWPQHMRRREMCLSVCLSVCMYVCPYPTCCCEQRQLLRAEMLLLLLLL